MKRDAEGNFTEISWEEAIKSVSSELIKTKDTDLGAIIGEL